MFFVYLELIQLYKDNAKVLIYDCTYNIVKSKLLLLYFDFVLRLRTVLLLTYMLMLDKTYEGYVQAFQQLQLLFEQYNIDNLEVFVYNRDRAAINTLAKVFLGTNTILYTQYIDTAVRAYAAKTFGQQKNKETNRFVLSELAEEFLALYRNCRYIVSKEAFNNVYTTLNERAKCGETHYDSDNSDDNKYYNTISRAAFIAAETDIELEEELDIIVRLLDNPTIPTTIVKDTLDRQQKIVRYLQTAQQVYKEKCIKVQTNKLRYFGINTSSGSKSAYKGLKVQTTSSRNDTLTFFIKLVLFYDAYLDREKAKLAKVQNTTSTAFVYKEYYYKINTVVETRGLYYIQKQREKLQAELEYIRSKRNYVRSPYTSVFTRIIGIDCSYKLEGKEYLTIELFDKFQIILGTYNTRYSPAIRLLELAIRLYKRVARLIRSY